MNLDAQKAVNELIVTVCELIQEMIKGDSATDLKQLPSLIEALAKLTN
ncbi:hypothetical protein [Paenibacillus rhizolycopersici]